mgnify:CR=1 FL=1
MAAVHINLAILRRSGISVRRLAPSALLRKSGHAMRGMAMRHLTPQPSPSQKASEHVLRPPAQDTAVSVGWGIATARIHGMDHFFACGLRTRAENCDKQSLWDRGPS